MLANDNFHEKFDGLGSMVGRSSCNLHCGVQEALHIVALDAKRRHVHYT